MGYRVQFTKPTDDATPSIEQEGTWNKGSSCTLTGLTPSTNYTIAVAAVNEEGTVGLYSDPVIVETESAGEQSVVRPSLFHNLLYKVCHWKRQQQQVMQR